MSRLHMTPVLHRHGIQASQHTGPLQCNLYIDGTHVMKNGFSGGQTSPASPLYE